MGLLNIIRRMHLRQKLSVREIARRTGLSRNTITKHLAEGTIEPKFATPDRPSKLDPFAEKLAGWLKTEAGKSRKQRRTLKQMHADLVKLGFTGSYNRVAAFARQWRTDRQREQQTTGRGTFVPLSFRPGEAFQFDWSEDYGHLADDRIKLQMAHIKLSHSRAFLLRAYPLQTHEMLFDAHWHAFRVFGGVPGRGIYDNMKTAVDRVGRGKERQVNIRFLAMANHYVFEPEFCNPAAGWEKGQVEKNVQDSRRQVLQEMPGFPDLATMNAWLEQRCLEVWQEAPHGTLPGTIHDVWAEERAALMPLPSAFDGFIELSKRVSPTCLISFERNRYSVPASFANRPVSLRIYPDRLVVAAEGNLLCEHGRVFQRNHQVPPRTIYDWRHYLAVLQRKPGALPAYGSDLNPVAVMIGKAMIEIPPKFKDMPPIHPGIKERSFYRNAEGLAEDVKYYGEWMREKAWERIGHLYPQVDLPKEYGGGKATVIAWIWARTVPSPDPAFSDVQVPIASSFLLSTKVGKEAWVEPIVDKQAKTISYRIRHGGTKAEIAAAKEGTKAGRGANFRCLMSDTAITPDYVKSNGRAGRMGQTLIAIVAEGNRSRAYVAPTETHETLALAAKPEWKPETNLPNDPRNFWTVDYGLTTFGDLFTDRQLVALNTLSNLVHEARAQIETDARIAGLASDLAPLHDGGNGAKGYAEALSVYLAFALNRSADRGSTICTWDSSPKMEALRNTFGRQSIPMTWDFAEGNPFSKASGNFLNNVDWVQKSIQILVPYAAGLEVQHDAQTVEYPSNTVISSDPPYYDNIGYADLSDFFFCWMKPAVRPVFDDIFGVLATPKAEELVATPYRHGSKEAAEAFFLDGMKKAIANMAMQSSNQFPATIYYAFKQSEVAQDGISSTGWATFLQAVVEAGYAVVGTWPLRTEMANRMIASGTNALANSVVLVCRKKEATADTITRAEFIRALKRELPPAIAELQAANIAPADMPQSAIGPGMGVFSRYKAVLESDDSPMSVKTALQLINRELDEYLGGIQGEFDADTRFAITWFEQNGNGKGDYGVADNLARARGISVESVKHAGIVESAAGKVRILTRDELDDDWEPEEDRHLTVWECLQHLVRQHEKDGISHDTAVLLKKINTRAEAVKDLAYCLYDISANKRKDAKEATAYNALIADWAELTRQAASIHDTRGDRQIRLDI